ncbi:MAG: disulfide bond formation protein DsbD [Micavibrio aeruginosavorus]|uniref:Disulfide bond formation protein DsbD n=1 Tax=Micavibrio aeruginosavorus TaxID=349221 RepID=A0A2W4ZZ11_9BACT|nr:MAG: disulfide bond formation protein DsbD [Micavibrio aeruginosavorus]
MKAGMFYKAHLLPALILSLFALFTIPQAANAQNSPERYTAIRLLPGKTDVKGGDKITVGIEQRIADGWHTYWINPGDSGMTTRIKWSGVDGVDAAPIEWPLPSKLPMGPLINFGFEGNPVLLQTLTLPENLPEGPQTLTANIELLVCHEICIPEKHEASFVINGDEEAVPAAIERARAAQPIEMGWPATYSEENGNLVVRIRTDAPSAFSKLNRIDLFPEEWGLIENTAATEAKLDGSTLILTHKRGDRDLSDAPLSKILITYEDPSGTRKGVRLSAGFEGAVKSGEIMTTDGVNSLGTWKAILFALFGGIILNLMPCVFPVLSMKALSLVNLKDKEAGKARLHGLAYTAGIIASFAVIAGILLALKAAGAQVGWGFQLQHPAVILFLAYLFFMLGLNLSGYFEINTRLTNIGQSLTQKTGITGSFFTGVLATLVATPCTAPFMGAAMGYALTQPAYVSMAVFLALGLGLAIPYLVLCFIPAARHTLPKPGAWMETFRQFLAFPMFASSCWLVWILAQQVSHMDQFMALLGLLAIAFALWLLRVRPAKGTGRVVMLVAAAAVTAFIISTFFMMKPANVDGRTNTAETGASQNWEDFTRARLQSYLEEDEPVFINMTAAWCITCKVNEKVALATDATTKLFADNNVRYLKGDWTNQNPEITTYLEEYGRSGVPIYVYYPPRLDKEGARPEPVILPQILTPGIVEKFITQTP